MLSIDRFFSSSFLLGRAIKGWLSVSSFGWLSKETHQLMVGASLAIDAVESPAEGEGAPPRGVQLVFGLKEESSEANHLRPIIVGLYLQFHKGK